MIQMLKRLKIFSKITSKCTRTLSFKMRNFEKLF